MWPQVKEGLAWVIGNRQLRAIAACGANFNLCFNIVLATFILYAARSLHLSAIEIGAIFAVGSAGAVCGALLANRIQGSIGIGPSIVSSAVLFSTGSIAFPLAPRSFPLPVLDVGVRAPLIRRGHLQRRAGQLSPGNHPRTPAGADECCDAVDRLGCDPAWDSDRWSDRPDGRAPLRPLGRRDRCPAAFLFVLLSPVRSIQAIPDEGAESTKAEIESAFDPLGVAPMSRRRPDAGVTRRPHRVTIRGTANKPAMSGCPTLTYREEN